MENSKEMPQICLGTVLHSENLEQMKTKFKEAIDHGYRHIDSAQNYNNMAIMPEVIQHGIKTYERDGFWITWKYVSINETKIIADINKLDCDYFDLVLIHLPSNNVNSNKKKMDILINLKNGGLIKNIGVSNYENPDKLIELNEYLKTKNCCIYANQIQARPIGAGANVIINRINPDYEHLLNVCGENNIRLMFFSPYNALRNRISNNNIKNNQDAEIINEILSNPDFGKKVISYYTRTYLVNTRNVLINGVTNGASCIQNYDTIKSILDGSHTNHNEINNANIFEKITKLKLTKM
jgi:diketogulonate reductase-like aldo/keto reductase